MRLADLLIVNSDLDFIGLVHGDFKIFIPTIRSRGMRAGKLGSFHFERNGGLHGLLRSRAESSNNWRVVQFPRTLNGDA